VSRFSLIIVRWCQIAEGDLKYSVVHSFVLEEMVYLADRVSRGRYQQQFIARRHLRGLKAAEKNAIGFIATTHERSYQVLSFAK
jgi:hypothetical protein